MAKDIIELDRRWLYGEDLRRDGVWMDFTLTITSVDDWNSARSADKQVIEGWPVHFKETKKVLVLNSTNTRLAIASLGTNSRSGWIGKTLTLYPVSGNWFQQQNVIAIRVRVPIHVKARPFIKPSNLGRDLTSRE